MVSLSIYCGNPVLIEYCHSFISRPDLFCNGKYVIATTFETSVKRVFKGFLWFFKLSHNMFYVLTD